MKDLKILQNDSEVELFQNCHLLCRSDNLNNPLLRFFGERFEPGSRSIIHSFNKCLFYMPNPVGNKGYKANVPIPYFKELRPCVTVIKVMLEGSIMFCRNTWEGMQLSQLLIQHGKAFWKSQCLKLAQNTRSGKGNRGKEGPADTRNSSYRDIQGRENPVPPRWLWHKVQARVISEIGLQ